LDTTLAYPKGKDAESEEPRQHADSSSLGSLLSAHKSTKFTLAILRRAWHATV
jgi:hypothetical protein